MIRKSQLCMVVGWVFLILALHRAFGVIMLIAGGGDGFYIFRHFIHAVTWSAIAEWFFRASSISGELNTLKDDIPDMYKKYENSLYGLPEMKYLSYIAGALSIVTAILVFVQVFLLEDPDNGNYVFSVVLEIASWIAIAVFFFLWGRKS